MTIENTNSDSKEWITSTNGLSTPNAAKIAYNAAAAMDDWFFTQGLQLTAGTSYEVSFAYRAASASYPEKLALDWGNDATSAAMSGTPIFDNNNVINTAWNSGSATFTPATTGTFYVGFHGYSDADKYYLFVDDIKIIEVVAATTWNGSTDSNWDDPNNWSNGIPSSTTDVTIPTGAANYPTLTSAATISSLLIESDASGDASLIGQEYLTITGTTTVEQYFNDQASAASGWHFLSSPMDNYTIATSDFVSGTYDLYRWGETTVADEKWLNYKDAGNAFAHTEFENGLGYLVSYAVAGTKSFTGGTLNSAASYTKTCTYTTDEGVGFNLLGNPYTSAIDWDLLTKTTVGGTVYVLLGTNGTYINWNGTTGALTDGIIPPHQGFFVEAASGGGTVKIERADQVHPNHKFYKSENDFSETLEVSLKGQTSENNTYFQFRDDATTDFDHQFDGYKLYGWATIAQVYSKLGDIDYSINCLPHSSEAVTVPLGIKQTADEDLTLDFSGLETFFNTIRIDLEDTKTGTTINVRENPSYSFHGEIADGANRFLLHFNGITAVEDIEEAQAPVVYSVDNSIYINTNKAINADIFIYNINGQLITQDKINGEQLKKVDVRFATGMYLVSIKTNEAVYTEKVMIK
jgi:hypothetical protein